MKSSITTKIISILLWGIVVVCNTPCEAQRWRTVLDFPTPSGGKDVVVLANGDIISLINTDSIFIISIDQQGAVKWRINMGEGIGLVWEHIDFFLLFVGTSGTALSPRRVYRKLPRIASEKWPKPNHKGYF